MKRPALALLAAAGLALTGCAGGQQEAAAPETVTTEGAAETTTGTESTGESLTPVDAYTVEEDGTKVSDDGSVATTSPSTSPWDGPVSSHLSIRCDDVDGRGNVVYSVEEAWKLTKEERYSCDAEIDAAYSNYVVATKAEQAAGNAARVSDDEEATADDIAYLYGMCASPSLTLDEGFKNTSTLESYDAQRIRAAFSLCKDHPAKKRVSAALKDYDGSVAAEKKELAEIKAGTRLTDGDYRVGKDIKPGTYVVESDVAFDGCYWSRLNKNGDIIDNNFINSGFRAQVTIRATDYSFSTERCGEWVKQ